MVYNVSTLQVIDQWMALKVSLTILAFRIKSKLCLMTTIILTLSRCSISISMWTKFELPSPYPSHLLLKVLSIFLVTFKAPYYHYVFTICFKTSQAITIAQYSVHSGANVKNRTICSS